MKFINHTGKNLSFLFSSSASKSKKVSLGIDRVLELGEEEVAGAVYIENES